MGNLARACHVSPLPSPSVVFDWQIVVNNGVKAPGDEERKFNSYNPPSLNVDRLVVFRARTKGGMGGGGMGRSPSTASSRETWASRGRP